MKAPKITGPTKNPPPPRSRRWIWITLGVLVVVLAAGALAARPIYRSVKSGRAHKYLEEAKQLSDRKDLKSAYQKIKAAIALAPWDATIHRAMAQFLTKHGTEEAFPYWERVFTNGEGTVEDRQAIVQLAMRTRRFDVASHHLMELLKIQPPSPIALGLAGDYYLSQKDSSGAAHYFREALRLDPASAEYQFRLASVLIASPDPQERGAAIRLLVQVTHGDSSFRDPALRLWVASANLTSLEAADLLKKIGSGGDQPADVLLRLDLAIAAGSRTREAAINEALKRFRGGTFEELGEVTQWLLRHRAYAETLSVITPALERQNATLFRNKLAAYAGLKQWNEGYELARAENAPLDPLDAELNRAWFASGSKKSLGPEAHWRRVFYLAGADSQRLLHVVDFARVIKAQPIVTQALEKLATAPRHAETALIALVRHAQERGQTSLARDYMRTLLTNTPDNPLWRNDEAYLSLLVRKNVAESFKTAEQLAALYPLDPIYQLTTALGRLRLNQPEQARVIIAALPADWFNARPGAQAVGVGVLAAAGQTNAARNLANQMKLARLRPEERAFVAPWIIAPKIDPTDTARQ